MHRSKHVTINLQKLQEFAEEVAALPTPYSSWEECHFKITEDVTIELVIAYIFLIDSVNFWFWPTSGFEYDDIVQNLNKLKAETPEFFTSSEMSKITAEEVGSKVFTPDFWLLKERARLIREVGAVITTFYDSSFEKFVKSCNGSASQLVDLIIEKMPGFRDESITQNGEQIFFYKRAQILVGDLYGALKEHAPDLISSDIDKLTMFPDYRYANFKYQLF